MKSVLKFLPAAALALGVALIALPAIAQQRAPAQRQGTGGPRRAHADGHAAARLRRPRKFCR